MAKVNYTPEMVETAKTMYAELGNEGMQEIADAIGRGVRSVRSKLVREGVYVADEKPAKVAVDHGPTKAELLDTLGEYISDLDKDGLAGATKSAIQNLIDAFEPEGEEA